MKVLKAISLALFVSILSFGQSNSASNNGATDDSSKIADQVKTLQSAISTQQKQIAAQQQQLEMLQKQLDAKAAAAATPHVENATLTTVNSSASVNPNTPEMQADTEKPKTSPLSFRIGGTEFTPGGFADFTNIFRTTNTGAAVSTTFGAIPFSNTAAGQISEFRSSGQYSRFNLKVNGKYGDNNVTGYIEADFNGNDAANVFVTTNPHTFRLRLYYLQLARHSWEFTLGQAWGLLTPNKVGVGASPSDLDTTLATDGNIMSGVMYSRDAQFRIAWKPSDRFGWALSVANPQQIAPGVTFPAFLGAGFGASVDGAVTAGVANLIPDISTKVAFDTNPTGRNLHFEVGGLLTSVQIPVPRPGVVGAFDKENSIGGGFFGGGSYSLTKKFRILAHGMYGPGAGRYFIGSGPMFVVVPVAVSPTTFTAHPSMVHAGSGFGGAEWQATSSTQIGAYYGGIYYGRNSFPDVSAPTLPIIGYGGVGSANNRAIQQGELVIAHTMWKNPQYGAFVIASDSSYVTRALWAHAATAPRNAHMFMQRIDFKYVLP